MNNLTIDEFFIVKFTVNCTDEFQYQPSMRFDVPIYLLVLSFVALILNSFSFYIFWQQKNKSVMRTSLLMLSMTEIMFHSSNLIFNLFKYSNSVFVVTKFWEKLFFSESLSFLDLSRDVFVSARNWCNLLISASRAEAIAFPLKTRKIFTRKKIFFILIMAACVATSLSLPRYLDLELTICVQPQIMTKMTVTLLNNVRNGLSKVYFTWQSGIPCFTVIACTVVMITVLLMKNNENLPNFSSQRKRNQYFAIRTVLCLAIIFSSFELPSVIMTFCGTDSQPYINIGNTLVLLDSIFNFLVYTFSLPYFRLNIQQFFCCKQIREPLRFYSTSCDKSTSSNKKYVNHSKCLQANHDPATQLIINFETQI